jgi:lactobin A/cerein 7B family class IIb bacteriocin
LPAKTGKLNLLIKKSFTIMKDLNLDVCSVQEMNNEEMRITEGGIFPIVILGVVITAKTAAWIGAGVAAAGVFGAGVYAGYNSAAN